MCTPRVFVHFFIYMKISLLVNRPTCQAIWKLTWLKNVWGAVAEINCVTLFLRHVCSENQEKWSTKLSWFLSEFLNQMSHFGNHVPSLKNKTWIETDGLKHSCHMWLPTWNQGRYLKCDVQISWPIRTMMKGRTRNWVNWYTCWFCTGTVTRTPVSDLYVIPDI